MQDIVSEEYVSSEQFFTLSQESHLAWNGERRLLLAVLEYAIQEFFRYRRAHTRRRKRLLKEVTDWIWSQENNWLYSFESICVQLDFDPETIRQRLQDGEADVAQSSCPNQLPQHKKASSPGQLCSAA
jgi:hypothetical protein